VPSELLILDPLCEPLIRFFDERRRVLCFALIQVHHCELSLLVNFFDVYFKSVRLLSLADSTQFVSVDVEILVFGQKLRKRAVFLVDGIVVNFPDNVPSIVCTICTSHYVCLFGAVSLCLGVMAELIFKHRSCGAVGLIIRTVGVQLEHVALVKEPADVPQVCLQHVIPKLALVLFELARAGLLHLARVGVLRAVAVPAVRGLVGAVVNGARITADGLLHHCLHVLHVHWLFFNGGHERFQLFLLFVHKCLLFVFLFFVIDFFDSLVFRRLIFC